MIYQLSLHIEKLKKDFQAILLKNTDNRLSIEELKYIRKISVLWTRSRNK